MSAIAAKAGRIDLLKWAKQNGGTFFWHLLIDTLEAKQNESFKWLVENAGVAISPSWGYHFNNLDILLWTESHGYDIQSNSSIILENAQAHHCLDILVYMVEERGVVLNSLEIAATNGNLEALKYGYDRGMKLDDTNYALAAFAHLDVLLWLESIGYKIFLQDLEEIASNAAGAGALNVLEWAITHAEWTKKSSKKLWHRICNNRNLDPEIFVSKAPDHIWEWALKSLGLDWQRNCSVNQIISHMCCSNRKDFWWVLPKLKHSAVPEYFLNFLIYWDQIAEIKWLLKNKNLNIAESSLTTAICNCKLEILEVFRTHPKNCAFSWDNSFILDYATTVGQKNVVEWVSNRYRI